MKGWSNFQAFKDAFSAAAAGQFGSGWAWLVKDAAGNVSIETTANAGCPLRAGQNPTVDLRCLGACVLYRLP